MSTDFSTLSISEKFEHLLAITSSERFLTKQGLGNEVPFFICPYLPADALEMEKRQKNLIDSLSQKGIHVLEVNLYDLAHEILLKRKIWDRTLQKEPKVNKGKFKELLQGILDPTASIIPAIAEKMKTHPFDILFLTGIGEVFPYIRSHNILNNLQSTAKEKPTLIFFPGDYTHSLEKGASLDLFCRFQDDKYYRAFNISQYEV